MPSHEKKWRFVGDAARHMIRQFDTQRERFGRGACFFVSGDVVFVALPEHLDNGYLISAVFSLSVKLRETEERRINLYNKGPAKATRRMFLRGTAAYRR